MTHIDFVGVVTVQMVSAIRGLFALHTYYRLSTIHYNTLQHNAARSKTIQYKTTKYSAIPYNTTQFSTIQIRTIDYSAIQCSKMPFPLLVICHVGGGRGSVICGSVRGVCGGSVICGSVMGGGGGSVICGSVGGASVICGSVGGWGWGGVSYLRVSEVIRASRNSEEESERNGDAKAISFAITTTIIYYASSSSNRRCPSPCKGLFYLSQTGEAGK